jgi:hypothetical protein
MTSPRLLDQVRTAIRARRYSRRTEDAYVHWIRRFIVFHGRRHPRELGAPEITVRRGKCQKDRRVMLPNAVRERLEQHLVKVRRLHHADQEQAWVGSCCPERWIANTQRRPTHLLESGYDTRTVRNCSDTPTSAPRWSTRMC